MDELLDLAQNVNIFVIDVIFFSKTYCCEGELQLSSMIRFIILWIFIGLFTCHLSAYSESQKGQELPHWNFRLL